MSRAERPEQGETTLQSLGQVTGELLHDIVGLLGVLSSRVALVREDARVGRPVTEEIQRIDRDCEYLRAMVEDILREIRGRERTPEISFPVRGTLQEVVDRWLVSAPSVTTRLASSAPESVRVAGPTTFFARAMANLLQNAARHARTEIRLSVDPEDRGGRPGVSVAIEDDGEGIVPEVLPRIFEPLARGTPGGTGLGLSFSRWAVRQLEGTIEHRDGSELGGARFEIWLPVVGSPEVKRRESGASSAAALDGLDGLRIVVVDDDPMIRRLYRRLLEKSRAGFVEVVPQAGMEVDDIAGEIAAVDPDAVLLDLNLSGWSGFDVWESLAEQAPRLARRVLFLSGDVWSGEEPPPGTPPVVSKLIEWKELVARIRTIAPDPERERSRAP